MSFIIKFQFLTKVLTIDSQFFHVMPT